MKKTLESLWNDYFADECAAIESEEERELTKKAIETHEKAAELLTKEQNEAVESYADALCDISSSFSKKAFFKGCEFALSLFLELGICGK